MKLYKVTIGRKTGQSFYVVTDDPKKIYDAGYEFEVTSVIYIEDVDILN